jgi:transposase
MRRLGSITPRRAYMVRHRLQDDEWALIADLFPTPAQTGRPPKKPRDMMDGILWILRSGAPWRDLPREFGKWSTVWEWFDKWNGDGTLDKVLDRLRSSRIDGGHLDGDLWCIDGTSVRAHRCAAGGGKKGIPRNRPIML